MNSVSTISLCMRPQVAPFGWEEFCETHPPYAIALDGYVAAGSRFDLTGPRLNLNHHSGTDRLATRASCAQTLSAIRQGLFECFRDGDGPQAQVCVNDCVERLPGVCVRGGDQRAPSERNFSEVAKDSK